MGYAYLNSKPEIRLILTFLKTYSRSAANTNRLQVQSQISMAVSPPLADLGEFVVTAFRIFIMAKKLITNRPDLAGITSNGGIRNEHQLTYKWELKFIGLYVCNLNSVYAVLPEQ